MHSVTGRPSPIRSRASSRYELEPVDGSTLVRETWDISQEKVKAFVRPARKRTIKAMEETLARIEQLVTA